jgi:hypothetical protein
MLRQGVIEKLDTLKETLHVRTRAGVIETMASSYHAETLKLATPENLLGDPSDTRPCFVMGPSGSGKTMAIKAALETWPGNLLVLDTSNEYTEIRKVADSRAIDWKKGDRVRIVPSPEEEFAVIEAAYIFRDLLRFGSHGIMKSWVVVTEECHRFIHDSNLRNLVLESRKSLRRLIMPTADAGDLASLCPVYRPLPSASSS